MVQRLPGDCTGQQLAGVMKEKTFVVDDDDDVAVVLVQGAGFWCWWGCPTSQHACGRLCYGYLPDVRARVIDCGERGLLCGTGKVERGERRGRRGL